jgi:L-rhamnose mutarotase
MPRTRRICLALDLHDDPDLIAEYERCHEPQNAWPEITRSIRESGIEEMEIWRIENRLFMVMDVNEHFSAEDKAAADTDNPAVQDWEKLMWKFQKPLASAAPGEKWISLKRVYKLSDVPFDK